jgi:hypothetical protein
LLSKASGSDLKIHSFGFGADHDPVLLQAISNAGNGTYYYVSTEENIAEAFADALGGLLSVVAQNVELRFTPAPTCTVSAPDNDLREHRDGSDLIISVQDLYAEEAKDVVVSVEMPEVEGTIESALVATLFVTYIDIVNGMPAERSLPLSLRRAVPPLRTAAANERVVLHRARLATAAAMLDAISLADAGRTADALTRLVCQMAALDSFSFSLVERSVSRFGSMSGLNSFNVLSRDLETCAEKVKSADVYLCSGKSYLRVAHKSHACQRSNALPMPPSPIRVGVVPRHAKAHPVQGARIKDRIFSVLCGRTKAVANNQELVDRVTETPIVGASVQYISMAPGAPAPGAPAPGAPAPLAPPASLYANKRQSCLVHESKKI